MENAVQIFFLLLLSGLLLIGLEIFLPGGVMGVVGGIALCAAVVISFGAFGASGGILAASAIVILLGLCLVVWIKYFPQTPIGRALTLSKTGKTFKANDEKQNVWLGKEGVTQTELHPSGIALIEGKRVDVVADGGWIDQDAPVVVIRVTGNHVTVRRIHREEQESS